MSVQVPGTDTVSAGGAIEASRVASSPARAVFARIVYARVSQGLALLYLTGRPLTPQQAARSGGPARLGVQKLATFLPFYRTYVFVAPPYLCKVIKGYAGGDALNRLKFIGRSGL